MQTPRTSPACMNRYMNNNYIYTIYKQMHNRIHITEKNVCTINCYLLLPLATISCCRLPRVVVRSNALDTC